MTLNAAIDSAVVNLEDGENKAVSMVEFIPMYTVHCVVSGRMDFLALRRGLLHVAQHEGKIFLLLIFFAHSNFVVPNNGVLHGFE